MSKYPEGQRAKIIYMPDRGQSLIGTIVKVCKMGPFSDPDEAMVVTESKVFLMVKDDQLEPVD